MKRSNTVKSLLKHKQNRIQQGGMRSEQGMRQPDVVLQMPEIFMFDMKAYMQSLMLARSIDYSNRARLYDMYDSAMLDLHLSGVLAKRLRGVTSFPIEFRRDGVTDDTITAQLRTPWFRELRKEIIMAEFWGFSLFQFYTGDDGNIHYDLINRKHYDPVRQRLLKFQGDQDGVPVEEFDNMLFVGTDRGLGIFAELLPAVLYKRGDMSDWAKFCNVFGMPIREYTYDAGDEDARRRLIADARQQGANAVYIHPTGSDLRLVEAGNKTGSGDLYKTFADYWDAKISIRVLGNTLTTDAQDTGTQALGSVHENEERSMNEDDRETILNVLNYDMRPIFQQLGFNVEGGEFVYAKKDKIDPKAQLEIVQGLHTMGLPLDDDWLYETFAIEKPSDYDRQKEAREERKRIMEKSLLDEGRKNKDEGLNGNTPKQPNDQTTKRLTSRLKSFFAVASPQSEAVRN